MMANDSKVKTNNREKLNQRVASQNNVEMQFSNNQNIVTVLTTQSSFIQVGCPKLLKPSKQKLWTSKDCCSVL